ncbi:hypothetical protein RFI_22752 [Reticulomyxa filosa]|uniref:Heat shock protein 70 n=1 Tax=Reticulomyxa filosa TaxID=46433 RepID=X6MKS7_RETFI|nr:hypothetical protein RFI_22752 [Reticulomyxa filosa]|eukprot:ETO14618.1 hypothetical protein RFI_22752 [Reticulomyxa filosa]
MNIYQLGKLVAVSIAIACTIQYHGVYGFSIPEESVVGYVFFFVLFYEGKKKEDSKHILALNTHIQRTMPKTKVKHIIGISLGGTNSRVGVMTNGKVEIIANELGNRATPSFVAFTETEVLVGDAAKNQAPMNPQNTIFGMKWCVQYVYLYLLLFDKEVQGYIKAWPFQVIDKEDKPYINVTYKGEVHLFSPEDICAIILKKMKEIAESYLSENITYAVLTVPAYFEDAQRTVFFFVFVLMMACPFFFFKKKKKNWKMAGFSWTRLFLEPYATANLQKLHTEANITVVHFGGTALGIAAMEFDEGVYTIMAMSKDIHLGLTDYFVDTFAHKHNVDLRAYPCALGRLRRACTHAKHALSSETQVQVEVANLVDDIDFNETLTRIQFEELNQDLFQKVIDLLDQVLQKSDFKKSDIQQVRFVVLSGGSTFIPKIRHIVQEYFSDIEIHFTNNPDETQAISAAIVGDIWTTPIPPLIPLEVVPLSIGIETIGGVMTRLLHRNTVIPTIKSRVFTTCRDNQKAMHFRLFAGEYAKIANDIFLAELEITGIEPAPRGTSQIEVTITVNIQDDVQVDLHARASKTSQNFTITSISMPSQTFTNNYLDYFFSENSELPTNLHQLSEVQANLSACLLDSDHPSANEIKLLGAYHSDL